MFLVKRIEGLPGGNPSLLWRDLCPLDDVALHHLDPLGRADLDVRRVRSTVEHVELLVRADAESGIAAAK